MYIPTAFAFPAGAEAELHDVIDARPFGILIASAPGHGIEAAHLPFLLDRRRGGQGTLMGHVARANPIWTILDANPEVLVIFSGPHGYVSPDWYVGEGLVPTWNYLVVHAYGRARIVDDPAATEGHLEALVDRMESTLAPKPPWRIERVAAKARANLMRAIVAFEIEIEHLQGKRKLNQNRSRADRAGVIAALERAGDDESIAVAALMRALDEA